MTPEQLTEKIISEIKAEYGTAPHLETVIRNVLAKNLADYDPVTEIMQGDEWQDGWRLVILPNKTYVITASIHDGPGAIDHRPGQRKIVATGATALEACQNAVKREETT